MARGKTKRPVSSSDEGEYDTSTASAETSPVPNSRKSSKRGPPGASAPLDKENSFTEADMAPSHAPGTVRKALYMHTRTENGTPTKRRLSSRADDMRRQSFTNLRFLDTQPSNASIDSQSSSSQGHAQASGSNQLSAQPRQTMGGRIAGLAAARGRTSLGGNSGVLLGADGSPAVSRQGE